MRAHDLRDNKLISGLVEEDDSVSPRHEGASNIVAAAVTQSGRIVFLLSPPTAWPPHPESLFLSNFCADSSPRRITSNDS